ncbi:response regulator [Rhizobium sp. LjRoot98]|uniref:response regulator n=1 Tax=unclassified Rhizobium TaxID=2613769 RepID=UPI000714A599|nr:response regulator [Rhizobium sp. Root1204]KQV36408.1 response regulator receiver protein [Rhizobium sp. Root1204]
MPKGNLEGRRILVVEDEYILASELCDELEREGAIVVGPVGQLEKAIELIEATDRIDYAILDVNLGNEPVFPVADLLAKRKVPFVFATGYDASIMPPRFRGVSTWGKPIDLGKVRAMMLSD